jgi:hypothetical protein
MRFFVLAVLLATGCAIGEWHPTPAEHPLTRAELGSRDVTVLAPDQELANAFAQAMTSEGFKVVSHPPYHMELALLLSVQDTPNGRMTVGTLRSDDFFVDEERAPDGSDAPATLARKLAGSQAMADFVRNNGLPQQTMFGPD